MDLKKFFSELKRRNVYKVAITYAITSWLLAQIIALAADTFGAPDWVTKIVFVVLVIGFPIALILAWAFEMSPQGMIRTSSSTAQVNPYQVNKKKSFASNLIIGILAVALIGQFAYNKYSVKTPLLVTNIEKTIAVLPFINLSNDPNQEYFSDGMMEEILKHLVKIKKLKVTSRTSSMQFKMSAKSLKEIGNELGVRYLLEGSVRKYEDEVRISTQLIEVESDMNLWSKSYDRKLVDIFSIQSDIAKNVAAELSMVLSPREIEQIDKRGTENLEAYNFYLKGRHFFHQRTQGSEKLKKCVEYFEKSLSLDPSYAIAYAGLADALMQLAWREWDFDPLNASERITKAKDYVRKALEIDPNLAEAQAVLGFITCFFDWQWEEGGKILEKAIELSPNYSTAHQYYSEYLSVTRQTDAARVEINKAIELNPFSMQLHFLSSVYYYNQQKFGEALIEVLKVKELDNNFSLYWNLFYIYWEQGKEEKAIQQLKHLWSVDSYLVEHIKFLDDIYSKNGMNGVIKWWMSFEENRNPNGPHYIAMNYGAIGENELALEYLERAFELGGPNLPSMKNNRMFASIQSNPRFISMLEQMGLVEEK